PDDLRAVTGETPSEVEGLVDTINSLMQRLDQALTALRNFTGNASRHLRTPLATVRAQFALAMRAKVQGSVSTPPKTDAARHATMEPTDIADLARSLTAAPSPWTMKARSAPSRPPNPCCCRNCSAT
ncbi:MAG: hypothetical protein H7317_00225, partial [Pseudorhodobacter sp.]|nr:hypothetical protein [Pseudorhodobacter sp.]